METQRLARIGEKKRSAEIAKSEYCYSSQTNLYSAKLPNRPKAEKDSQYHTLHFLRFLLLLHGHHGGLSVIESSFCVFGKYQEKIDDDAMSKELRKTPLARRRSKTRIQ
jgi:hypothetical protein